MQKEPKGVIITPVPRKPLKLYIPLLSRNSPAVNIAVISAIAFYFNIYRKDNEVFITSLYKINRIISKREETLAEETDKGLIKRLLFTIYNRVYRESRVPQCTA